VPQRRRPRPPRRGLQDNSKRTVSIAARTTPSNRQRQLARRIYLAAPYWLSADARHKRIADGLALLPDATVFGQGGGRDRQPRGALPGRIDALVFTTDDHGEIDGTTLHEVFNAQDVGIPVFWLAGPSRLSEISSVASFFLSRIDTKVDKQLPEGSPLRGQVALASARVTYQRCLAKFAGAEFERLEGLNATRQRPLWASTGTKNPDYWCFMSHS
jgi:hypothetical protein